ncbi:MAG: hypothetical protein F7C34_04045 [Desulfurococcales archaeon]|nr:hypothetical protein [Desulfurococcales archaeon]
MIEHNLVVFTDIDHTMLGPGASVDDVPLAVETFERTGTPVVPVTAKSIFEIVATARILGLWRILPILAIAESGAAVYAEPGLLPYADGQVLVDSKSLEYVDLSEGLPLNVIDRTARAAFRSAGCNPPPRDASEMSAEELSRITGLPLELAGLIGNRVFMKIYYHPDSECKRRAAEILRSLGFHVGVGRNFIHVGKHRGKGAAVDWARHHIPRIRGARSVGFGDSGHDVPMLELVDLPVVIPPPSGEAIRLSRADYIVAPYPAPHGWALVSRFIQLNLHIV